MPEGERHVETMEIILIALKDVLQRQRFNRTYRRGIRLLIVYCAHATMNRNCQLMVLETQRKKNK